MKFNLSVIKKRIKTKLDRLERGTLTKIQKIIIRNELEHDLELIEELEKNLREKLIELGVKFKDFDYTDFLSYEDDREEIFRKGYEQGQLDLIEEILGEG